MKDQLKDKCGQINRPTVLANRLQFMIGILCLLLGSLVYVIDRSPDQVYFTKFLGINSRIIEVSPNVLGLFGKSLPAFFHPLSLILITASFFIYSRKKYIIICAGWLLVDLLFEAGQKYKDFAISLIPDFFNQIPFLEGTKNYFKYGSFDSMDVFAYGLGALAGYFVLIITSKRSPT
jgi:hypothetical protein